MDYGSADRYFQSFKEILNKNFHVPKKEVIDLRQLLQGDVEISSLVGNRAERLKELLNLKHVFLLLLLTRRQIFGSQSTLIQNSDEVIVVND